MTVLAVPQANVLVAGTSVFGGDKSVAAALESLRNAVTQVAQWIKRNFQKKENLCNSEW